VLPVIELSGVTARGPAERGRTRTNLTNVSFRTGVGVLAVLGTYRDGTSLLLDVIDGTQAPRSGRVVVLGESPDGARGRVARVSLEAPLPEALRVEEVCDLAADVRGEARRPAKERLDVLGVGGLAGRRVATLSVAERRTVTLALALSSSRAEVLLVEEPLVALDPVAPRSVIDALHARSTSACVIVTTASARDGARLADRLGILAGGVYAPLAAEDVHVDVGIEERVAMRIVVAPSHGKSGAAALVAKLSEEAAVGSVDTSTYAGAGAVAIVANGHDLGALASAVTRAIGSGGVEVELVEPAARSLDAIRAALLARAVSPPAGSLPPGPGSIPPGAMPGPIPPPALPPASTPPPSSVPPSGGVA
jgi:ABC-type multidrug transport system ATPase subunit